MSKEDRLQTDEVYAVKDLCHLMICGSTAKRIDPFLEPLVSDIETGFIEGVLSLLIVIYV